MPRLRSALRRVRARRQTAMAAAFPERRGSARAAVRECLWPSFAQPGRRLAPFLGPASAVRETVAGRASNGDWQLGRSCKLLRPNPSGLVRGRFMPPSMRMPIWEGGAPQGFARYRSEPFSMSRMTSRFDSFRPMPGLQRAMTVPSSSLIARIV